ncbi:MAG: hypothetical protein Q8O56_09165, partial [Solirubrobacteraceae bacterium]|nr:hypothetical protein [Solirubrobacteraceae bacterium]
MRAAYGVARDDARAALAGHPRHVLLAALVAGLLCGPRWPAALALVVVLVPLGVRAGPLAAGAIV